jgi:hypothetical protein
MDEEISTNMVYEDDVDLPQLKSWQKIICSNIFLTQEESSAPILRYCVKMSPRPLHNSSE